METISYEEFVTNFDKYKGKVVFSCWRNTIYNDYAKTPSGKWLKNIKIEIK
ncbi:MAG: hypothetical protein IIW71_11715 [Treponema sp.]|nr:hypothetical protein [Treponema sp.]